MPPGNPEGSVLQESSVDRVEALALRIVQATPKTRWSFVEIATAGGALVGIGEATLPRPGGEDELLAAAERMRAYLIGQVADPATLSGGQRARVALMRALLAQPRALLLDEPFSRMDAGLRERMREFVFATVRSRDIPVLLVTHDEADIADAAHLTRLQG